jgi:membrane protein
MRTGQRAYRDGVTTIASGIAFFVVLAAFPGIGAVVALYSLLASPTLAETLVSALPIVLPAYAVEVIARQVRHLSSHGAVEVRRLGITSAVGFAILLVSANRGTAALFRGLNVVYGCNETRGLLAFIAISLAFTIGVIVFLVFAIGAVILLPGILRALGLREATAHIFDLLRWPVILVVVAVALSIVYRFGPSRHKPD